MHWSAPALTRLRTSERLPQLLPALHRLYNTSLLATQHSYLFLVVCLILTQDASFNSNAHKRLVRAAALVRALSRSHRPTRRADCCNCAMVSRATPIQHFLR